MKWTYILVVVFAVWCWAAAQWYLAGIKGLPGDIENFNPSDSTIAILEILVMLVGAFLIGFLVAWIARKKHIQQLTNAINKLVAQNSEFSVSNKSMLELEQKYQLLNEAKEAAKRNLLNVKSEKETLENASLNFKEELDTYRTRSQKSEAESSLLKIRVNELEAEILKTKSRTSKMLTSAREGDDLTEIKGIGPVISKKLNGVGIFSFQQIADLTDDTIEKLNQTILRFPRRIGKDQWREQAAELVRQKAAGK